MFAKRFTALVDACSLVDVLGRDLLLTLAEAEFFRLRWSAAIMDETEAALAKIFRARSQGDPAETAKRARRAMEAAFEDAMVSGFEGLIPSVLQAGIPDGGDAHVIAAAIKTRASVIVTENQKHFPAAVLGQFDIEVTTADAFIADTISLETAEAVAAVRRMRQRYTNPVKTTADLLLALARRGFVETEGILREHVPSL